VQIYKKFPEQHEKNLHEDFKNTWLQLDVKLKDLYSNYSTLTLPKIKIHFIAFIKRFYSPYKIHL